MVELMKQVLALALKVAEWLPGVRRARERRALRRAIAEHDEAEMNRLFQQRRDKE